MPTAQNYYDNPYQYSMEDYTTSTSEGDGAAVSYSPGYLQELLELRRRVRAGTASAWDRENYAMQEKAARAVPMRDVSRLSFNAGDEAADRLSGGSPDLAHIMLTLAEKLERGQANSHERNLFQTTYKMLADQNYRASVPQESDKNPFGMGNNLTDALMMLATGASGGAAAAALAGGGLTLAGLSGLAGATSGITSMLSEPLDSKALKLAGMAVGAAGGVTSLASLLSNGLNSVGDVVKAVQKVYGTGTKAMSLIHAVKQAGDNPAALKQAQQAADNRTQGRTVGSNTQASTAQGDGMDFSQLGPALAGIVGMVGQGLSLSDASRYMEQLKDKFGDEQQIKDMIDQAYQLAVRRYETTYARTEEEYKQKQEQYTQQKERYETHYQDTRKEQEQKQAAYAKGEGQIDRDREAQIENFYHTRERADTSYNQRVAEAAEDRERKINVFGEDRQTAMADYNRRVQEAAQDRQKEYQTYDQQMARHMGADDRRQAEVAQDRAKQYSNYDTQFDLAQKNQALREGQTAENRAFERGTFEQQRGRYDEGYDRQVRETAEERELDKAGYQARHAIGADLRDPAKLAAGAQAVYNPLSAAARDRINVQSEEEMARRGVAGGGMYSNLLAAKAFAPQEAQLWQNAMQNYMAGQTGALTAYGNVDLASSPEYRTQNAPTLSTAPGYDWRQLPQFSQTQAYNWAQNPNFTKSPEFKYTNVPEMPGTPKYEGTTTPTFSRTSTSNVPGAVGRPETPTVPHWTAPGEAPRVPGRDSLPTPYQAYDGGKNSAMTKLVGELTKAMSSGGAGAQVLQSIIKAMSGGGGGDALKAFTAWGGDETKQPWYDPANMDWGAPTDSPYDPWSYDSPDYEGGMENMPYDDWSY